MAGFPNVIGPIDGMLIPIRTPSKDEHLYVCHKGYHAINVMAVSDASLKFTNIVAKWHGSAHDSAVFNSSMLNVHLEISKTEGWLLGDRGYGLHSYLTVMLITERNLTLMTPLVPEKISTPVEAKYQKCCTKTRNAVERCFGVHKQRFHRLDSNTK